MKDLEISGMDDFEEKSGHQSKYKNLDVLRWSSACLKMEFADLLRNTPVIHDLASC